MKNSISLKLAKTSAPRLWIIIVILMIGGIMIGVAGMPDILYA